MSKRLVWLAIALVVIATRLCEKDILWVEEAYPTAAAMQVLHGNTLYRDIWFDKPPLFAWLYALWGAQTGWILRLVGAAFVLLAAWTAQRASRLPREGLWAAGLTALFLTFDTHSAVMALTPDLLLVPLQFAAVGLAIAGSPLLAGFCAGVGFMLNVKALLVVVACLLWLWPQRVRLLAGFALPVAAGAIVLLLQGAAIDYWRQVWVWGSAYSRDTLYPYPLLEGARRTVNWAGFHSALVAGVLVASWREKDWRWGAWIVISLGAVVLGWRFFPRYYFHLLPCMVLLAARGFAQLPTRYALILAAFLIVPVARFGPRYIEVAQGKPWSDLAMFDSSKQAASLLTKLGESKDTLLVWGYRPELFSLTKLPAGTKFLDSQPLNGVIADRHLMSSKVTFPGLAEENRKAVLAKPLPTWVADGLGPYNALLDVRKVWPDLMDRYELDAECPGFRLFHLITP